MSTPLEGTTAVVTGASSGIGEATARALASAGARVALLARRRHRLESLAGELGDRATVYEVDVTDDEAVANTVEEVVRDLGGIDVLVNNAGYGSMTPAAEADLAEVAGGWSRNGLRLRATSLARPRARRAPPRRRPRRPPAGARPRGHGRGGRRRSRSRTRAPPVHPLTTTVRRGGDDSPPRDPINGPCYGWPSRREPGADRNDRPHDGTPTLLDTGRSGRRPGSRRGAISPRSEEAGHGAEPGVDRDPGPRAGAQRSGRRGPRPPDDGVLRQAGTRRPRWRDRGQSGCGYDVAGNVGASDARWRRRTTSPRSRAPSRPAACQLDTQDAAGVVTVRRDQTAIKFGFDPFAAS